MKRAQLLLLGAAVLLGSSASLLRKAAAAGDEVDIIVNKSNTTGDLTLALAQKVFKGDKSTWPNGRRMSIFMFAPGQPERAVILREVYKMSDGDYSKFFLDATFSGLVTAPPKEATSATQMKQMVVGNPGGIGYVKKSDVDDSVKVVLAIP